MQKSVKTIYACSKCDAQSPKWAGRCFECGEWGSLREAQKNFRFQISDFKNKLDPTHFPTSNKVLSLSGLENKSVPRTKTSINELDKVLGGGIVPGSLILLGGEPGIGKSTLLLQVAASFHHESENYNNIQSLRATPHLMRGSAAIPSQEIASSPALRDSRNDRGILYVSGEESAEQLKNRLDRLKLDATNLQYLGETRTEQVCGTIAHLKPALAIIDSIQTLRSEESASDPGSVAQIKIGTALLASTSRETAIPIIIVGHVTKGGALAGPKTLEHLVDVVLEFSGDRASDLRVLRAIKNRFGASGEMAFFEMTTHGLEEVADPSKMLLSGKTDAPGSVVGIVMEGSRPLAVEMQALVNRTSFGYPKRQAVGFDLNKLQLLAAVISKRTQANLNFFDTHLKVVGGFRVSEPAADLPVVVSMMSALKNKAVDPQTVALGEVGLGGEVRPVAGLEKRLKEAERLGFKQAIVPKGNLKSSSKIKLIQIKNVGEVLELL